MRLLKIPERIGHNIRRIILGYALNPYSINGNVSLNTYKWYVDFVRTGENKVIPDVIMMSSCQEGNIELFEWSVNECLKLISCIPPAYVNRMVFDLFGSLGQHPLIDMARSLAAIFDLNGIDIFTKYNTHGIATIIREAYENNNKCVVEYLLMNFRIPGSDRLWVRALLDDNADHHMIKYFDKKYSMTQVP
jgi:hypothetical protein